MNDVDSHKLNPYEAPSASIALSASWLDDPFAPPLAFLGWRIVALIADYLIFLSLLIGLFTVPMILAGFGPPQPFGPLMPAKAFGTKVTGPCFFLIWVVYVAGLKSSRWQATLGKRLFSLRVAQLDNSRVSFGRASVRALIKLLGLFGFFLGLIPALFTQKRQSLHDLVCGTVVVHGLNLSMIAN